jgi:hypothetical protein
VPELPGLCGAPHDQNNVANEYRLCWFLAMRPANSVGDRREIAPMACKNTPSTSAFAAAHLTAKGIRELRLETGLRRFNFIAASEASETCCAVEPNGGA